MTVQFVQPTLTLMATTFNKDQLQAQLDALKIRNAPQIALAGRSNVGKSSLVNALARRRQLAKISATPGKTRSINFYWVEPDNFALVDLPGYGYARCSHEERRHWAKLIEYYLTDRQELKALALLLDCRIAPQALDRDLADAHKLNVPNDSRNGVIFWEEFALWPFLPKNCAELIHFGRPFDHIHLKIMKYDIEVLKAVCNVQGKHSLSDNLSLCLG